MDGVAGTKRAHTVPSTNTFKCSSRILQVVVFVWGVNRLHHWSSTQRSPHRRIHLRRIRYESCFFSVITEATHQLWLVAAMTCIVNVLRC